MSEHTPGPWIVATSNSWRRILTQRGKPVCIPTKSAADGHPDLIGRSADLELMSRAPEMSEEIERLQKRLAEAEEKSGKAEILLSGVLLMFRAAGYSGTKGSNNPIESWIYDAMEWKAQQGEGE